MSKSWKSIISDPFFVKTHLHKSSRNPYIWLIPLHNIKEFHSARHYRTGSCNGLTCFINYDENKFYLWNPSTTPFSENLTFFSFPIEYSGFHFRLSFGYDNLTNKYKLVAFASKEVRVFTFGDNVCKNLKSFSVCPYQSKDNEGVYLNNSLNWFALLNNIGFS